MNLKLFIAALLFSAPFCRDQENGTEEALVADLLAGKTAADLNRDGATDGRDVAVWVDRETIRTRGIYDGAALANARRHSRRGEYVIGLEAACKSRAKRHAADAATTDIKRLIQTAVYISAYDHLSGDRRYRPALATICDSLAARLPAATAMSRDEMHNYMQWQIPELCRAASLSTPARDRLYPLLVRLLDEIKAGTLKETNIGVGLRNRVWLQRVVGEPCDPMADYGKSVGGRHILAWLDDYGLPTWDVASPKYWAETSRPAIIAALWLCIDNMTEHEQRKFWAFYFLPIRICVNGVTPLVGEDSIKRYPSGVFYGGLGPRDWPGADNASAWARQQMAKRVSLTFDDLTMPEAQANVPLPDIATGDRDLGRIAITEIEAGWRVEYKADGVAINGGHTFGRAMEIEVKR
ncbi:MAG: hypothetical protein IPK83_18670 [Planctomycetes bacterium]|nr:hypothetical protein [Planctomycetota bacterium]